MKTTVHISLMLLTLAPHVFGQVTRRSSIGGMAGAPMRMGFGARGIGLGNAMSAMTVGDVSSYYNPAVVPFQIDPVAMATYSILSLDRGLNFLSYVQSLKPSAGLSIGILNSGVSNIEGRDRDGLPTETYSTSENAFFFSFGIKIAEQLSVGVTGKLLYYSLFHEVSSSTVGLDIGALYRLTDEASVAIVIQDINSKYVWDTSKLYGRLGNATTDYYPLRKKLAIVYSPSWIESLLSAELEFVSSETFFRVGSEVNLVQGLDIRGGFDQVSTSLNMNAKPSMGISFQSTEIMWKPGIQYTYVFEPFAPQGIHIISVTARFE